MDLFIEVTANLSVQLLPILGVTALIVLIDVLVNVSKLIKGIRKDIKGLDKTVELVNTSLDKAQKPLDTAVELSKTVDKVHESGIIAVKEAAGVIASNISIVKDYMNKEK